MCEKLLETLFLIFLCQTETMLITLNLKPKNVDESLSKKSIHNPFIIYGGLVWNTKCLLILTSWFSQVSKLTHDKSTCTLACFHVNIKHCHMHVAKFLGAHWHGFQMHIAHHHMHVLASCQALMLFHEPVSMSKGARTNFLRIFFNA